MKKLNPALTTLCQILSDGQFHDGTSLGNTLSISRTAIWKMVNKLEEYGIKIESVKGKGYAIAEPLYLLDNTAIASALNDPIPIHVFEQIDSTNHYLKNLDGMDSSIIACVTETQSAGKGRFQRSWHSPFGQNIYLSLRYPFKKDLSELAGLNLVTSLSTCETIEQITELDSPVQIKWPSDILYNHKKLSCSLIEAQAEANDYTKVIIGIGLNVNMTQAPKNKVDPNWSSLRLLTHKIYNRNTICATLIQHLIKNLKLFESDGLTKLLPAWRKRDALHDQTIQINSDTGTALGVNARGHLRLKSVTGTLIEYSAGSPTLLDK